MISQKQIQTLNIRYSKLKKIAEALKSEVGELVVFDDKVEKVQVRTLFDGNDSLSELFVSGYVNSINTNIKFERFSIDQSIEIDAPLMLISDDTEIDSETAAKLSRRTKITDAPTFPVIIFSNDYFILREGESLGYIQTCDSLSRYSKWPIMPFRKQDIFEQREIVVFYVNCIAEIVSLFNLTKQLEAVMKKYNNELEGWYKKYEAIPIQSNDAEVLLEKLSLNSHLTALVALCKKIEESGNKIKTCSDELEGFINKLHEEYNRHIDSIVTHKNAEGDSAYSVMLDLKYGILNEHLKQLCSDIEKKFSYDELVDLWEVVSQTRMELGTSAAELAFIGTFSSGKTTLINTLLGHKHKLRTSGAHNTAVLMELCYTQDSEYYEVIYKDELRWDVIDYNSFGNKNLYNTFKCEATVINIVKHRNGNTIVYKSNQSNEIREIEIGNHKPAVNKGSVVSAGQSFVEQYVDKDVVRLCSRSELDYIEKLIGTGSISDVCMGQMRNIAKIEQFITQLKSLYKNIENSSAQPTFKVEDIRKLLGSEFEKCVFKCKLVGFKTRRFELSEVGWERFTAEGDSSAVPFCESPECYMPAQEIKVHLQSEFLKYCTITDTPGFGSITEKHDAITEKYLMRGSSSKLITMITINDHTLDMKFYDLLNKISEVFKTYRKDQMGNVSFVLNCFTNKSPLVQCERTVKKVVNDIKELGFAEKDNIYVDNLREVLDSSSDKRVFIVPFPSYYSFKTDCLNKFLTETVVQKYGNIKKRWENFFARNFSWIENRIDEYKRTLDDTENRVIELNRKINQIELVQFESEEYLVKKIGEIFEEYYKNFEYEFRRTRKGIVNHYRWAAVNKVLDKFKDEIKDIEQDEKDLASSINQCFTRLSYYADERLEREKIDLNPPNRLIVVTFERIRSTLNEADDNTHWYNKSEQTDYYMSRLHDIINQDKALSCSNIHDFCLKYKYKFEEKKKFFLKQFRDELSKADDKNAVRNSIRKYEELRDKLTAFKMNHFDKIEFKTILEVK